MMDHYQHIAGRFQQTIELIAMSVDSLAGPIEESAQRLSNTLLEDRKIIACGNGADGALAQLIVSNLLNRFEHDRPALPAHCLGLDAASLTGIAASNSVNDMYSRQIRALGQPGDVLLCISSGTAHDNLLAAVAEAHEKNISVIALTNTQHPALAITLREGDICLEVDTDHSPRAVELHTMIIQCLCHMIELSLFGEFTEG